MRHTRKRGAEIIREKKLSRRIADACLKSRLGRCSRCTRSALLAALAAWGVALAVWHAGANPVLSMLCTAMALSLAALWLAHLLAASIRATRFLEEHSRKRPDHPIAGAWSRRTLIVNFSRVLGLTALVSLAPRRWAFAQNCQCETGCKPGYNVYLKQCFCCPDNTTICYDEASNWCCLEAGCDCQSTPSSCQ